MFIQDSNVQFNNVPLQIISLFFKEYLRAIFTFCILMKEEPDSMIDCPDGFDSPLFSWDKTKCSVRLLLDDECLRCTSKEGSGFKTVLGNERFIEGGRYYFEIFLNKGELLKIGVSRPDIANLQQAFCDGNSGWAIYNGETRHNSNSTGPKYGTKLQSGDIIGVAVDMVTGTLTYYRNGQCWGVAFKDEELRKGELVAAVSPIYVNDVFTLRSMIKED